MPGAHAGGGGSVVGGATSMRASSARSQWATKKKRRVLVWGTVGAKDDGAGVADAKYRLWRGLGRMIQVDGDLVPVVASGPAPAALIVGALDAPRGGKSAAGLAMATVLCMSAPS